MLNMPRLGGYFLASQWKRSMRGFAQGRLVQRIVRVGIRCLASFDSRTHINSTYLGEAFTWMCTKIHKREPTRTPPLAPFGSGHVLRSQEIAVQTTRI